MTKFIVITEDGETQVLSDGGVQVYEVTDKQLAEFTVLNDDPHPWLETNAIYRAHLWAERDALRSQFVPQPGGHVMVKTHSAMEPGVTALPENCHRCREPLSIAEFKPFVYLDKAFWYHHDARRDCYGMAIARAHEDACFACWDIRIQDYACEWETGECSHECHVDELAAQFEDASAQRMAEEVAREPDTLGVNGQSIAGDDCEQRTEQCRQRRCTSADPCTVHGCDKDRCRCSTHHSAVGNPCHCGEKDKNEQRERPEVLPLCTSCFTYTGESCEHYPSGRDTEAERVAREVLDKANREADALRVRAALLEA